jgi:hypothetical protein
VINACEQCGGGAGYLLYVGLGCFVAMGMLLGTYYYCRNLPYVQRSIFVQFISNIDSGTLKVIWVTYQIIVTSSFTLSIQVSMEAKKTSFSI